MLTAVGYEWIAIGHCEGALIGEVMAAAALAVASKSTRREAGKAALEVNKTPFTG